MASSTLHKVTANQVGYGSGSVKDALDNVNTRASKNIPCTFSTNAIGGKYYVAMPSFPGKTVTVTRVNKLGQGDLPLTGFSFTFNDTDSYGFTTDSGCAGMSCLISITLS